MMPTFEFFYDCSSPWTYLAFRGVQPIAERLGVEIQWRPILVGGVFNAVNQDLYAVREKAFADETKIDVINAPEEQQEETLAVAEEQTAQTDQL